MSIITLLMQLYHTGKMPDRIRVGTFGWLENSAGRFMDNSPPPPRYLVDKFIEQGICGIVYGVGGCGKSVLALYLMILLAISEKFKVKLLGQYDIVTSGKVLYASAEEPEQKLWERVWSIAHNVAAEFEIPFDDLKPLIREALPTFSWQHLHIVSA